MGLSIYKIITCLVLLILSFCLNFVVSIDTITSSQFIKDPETIVSAGNIFKLGFFSPVNSKNRYVGIWYSSIPILTPLWVANRNKPLNDSSGVLTISEDGKLVILNGLQEILWSSNVSNVVNNSVAQLGDDGNLVLRGQTNGNSIWESFQYPADALISKMRLSANTRTGDKRVLTSWTSPSDPCIGHFYLSMEQLSIPEVFVWKDNRLYWRSGPWNGQVFIGIPEMFSAYLDGFDLVKGSDGTVSLGFTYVDKSFFTTYVLRSEGNLAQRMWDEEAQQWSYDWYVPKTECDIYGKCGAFGSCNAKNSPICSCLRGFVPKNEDEWHRGNWTSGSLRRTLLQCDRIQNGSEVGKADVFLKLQMIKVPNFAEYWSSPSSEQECKDACLNNCSCVAYLYYSGFGCMSWTGNLIDIQKFSRGGTDLNIRLAYSELDKERNKKLIITASVIVGGIIIFVSVFFSWRWMRNHRERRDICDQHAIFSGKKLLEGNMSQAKIQELPLFNLKDLATATDNFDISNKLGQGGFGPVYKGKLPEGQEIAVKRLSRASGQGQEEFMNEVVVISKLQHRNLVRLLGCCVEGEEKMLIYEHMPNKSLDAFLFDPLRKELLDWKMRFNIVEGICRGLLYLHRDSRLKIIHRDLKASNILLDKELNAKISDFGMARIFSCNEDQANTARVVGTYGYMSPEYVMEGRFSEKSDVFSFGVLLLEVVSGRRNTGFRGKEQALSLIGFAWKLWNEGKIAALVDSAISDPCFEMEILRCIHVGLLCVQEFAKDRPVVSTIISMLKSEIVDLPTPKKPAFAERQTDSDTESLLHSQNRYSINNVTVSDLKAR